MRSLQHLVTVVVRAPAYSTVQRMTQTTRSRIVTGLCLVLATALTLKIFQWSITSAVEYSSFAAFWVGTAMLTVVIWLVDVVSLKKWSVTEALFVQRNRAVATVLGALILAGAVMFSRV